MKPLRTLLIGLGVIGCTGWLQAQSLPDTCYRSAEVLVVAIERLDTTTTATIDLDKIDYPSDQIFTFRGSPERDMPQQGCLVAPPDSIVQVWCYQTGSDDRTTQYGTWYGGAGWTGQPLYVEWSDSLVAQQRASSSAVTDHFAAREVIVGSLSGEICFLDFESGKASRAPYQTGNPIKGTPSLDPRLNGLLYVGQGVPHETPFGALTFDLMSHRIISCFDYDPKAWRGWGAYDSSPVVVGDFVIRPGENGGLYKWVAHPEADSMHLHTVMRYRVKGQKAAGMEASAAIYRNYCYTLDNHGNVVCTNLDTMHPVWYFFNGDDCDASPLLLIEEAIPMLYVGSAVDKQGEQGYCHFTKLDGRNGEVVWQQRFPCERISLYGRAREAGMFATPLVGRGDCEGLLFTNLCGLEGERGTFVAIDRRTGQIRYRTALKHYSWSSPVGLYTPEGALFVFTGDVTGYGYLIEGATGTIRFVKHLAANFEASPIVVGDRIVIGSRGREIYQFQVR
ncbi:MAG: PQQ-binding-like beta-propeller repeat protein [Alistipes sp.]|nr:PQQ-binding-like beta-propeller repeat protein [Alistipes sp.]